MTSRRKKKEKQDGFMKKVSSLFNLDTVRSIGFNLVRLPTRHGDDNGMCHARNVQNGIICVICVSVIICTFTSLSPRTICHFIIYVVISPLSLGVRNSQSRRDRIREPH